MTAIPRIALETPSWALLEKPHGMPSAPLREGEAGTLLGAFLAGRPEAAGVTGRKAVERGLLHRLDTGTAGLVLVAKTQAAYDFLLGAQRDGRIEKTYVAFCTPEREVFGNDKLPFRFESRFRAYGPGRKMVRPLFRGERGFDDAGTDYGTVILEARKIEDPAAAGRLIIRMRCALTRGYRHQVRAHLAWLGCPIAGDEIYNPGPPVYEDPASGRELPLQLYAPGISFPDPDTGQPVSFSLPPPDKMSR